MQLSCSFLIPFRTISLLLTLLLSGSIARSADSLPEAARLGDREAVRALLSDGLDLGERDEQGNTALHWAALRGDTGLISDLLRRGVEVDATNRFGATPLLYAVGRLGSVRALVRAGAEVNHASQFGTTPLIAAARYPESTAVVSWLLQRGADPTVRDQRGASALEAAGIAGDLDTYKLLLAQGEHPGNITRAAMLGHREIVEAALAAGAVVNANHGFAGHALNWSLYGHQPEVANLLIQHGADLTLRSPTGQHETPPILWAAYSQYGDASVGRRMIEQGVDVQMQSMLGENALDWALARGNVELASLLRRAGVGEGSAARKDPAIPERQLPELQEFLAPIIRRSVDRALALLQRSSDVFLESGVVRRQQCVSCHQQTLPAVSLAWARDRGHAVDHASIARMVQDQVRYWNRGDKVATTYEMIPPQPDAPVLLGYGLLGLSSLGYPRDDLTDAMSWYLTATQGKDGSWPAADMRPPMEDGPIQGAAFAMRALQLYPRPGGHESTERTIDKARAYLRQARPVTFNQQVFQLMGLGWAGERPRRITRLSEAILAQQHTDGGWSQLGHWPSDAWATGQALVALHLATGMQSEDPVYQRGVRFLLRTQFEDGSWFVRSRAWPFQPHFESEFPHGKDQWISAGGTAWAVMALLLTEPRVENVAPADWMNIVVGRNESEPAPADTVADRSAADPATIDFTRDIEPVLSRSCGACHGGEKVKGQFSIRSRETLIRGGQSGEPAIRPGNSDASPLIRMVTDQVEDLEMPPLGKREKYPALSPEEVSALKTWIDEGLIWPSAPTP